MKIDVADRHPELLANVLPAEIVVERLQSDGPMLENGYDLFEQVFDRAVLDRARCIWPA